MVFFGSGNESESTEEYKEQKEENMEQENQNPTAAVCYQQLQQVKHIDSMGLTQEPSFKNTEYLSPIFSGGNKRPCKLKQTCS